MKHGILIDGINVFELYLFYMPRKSYFEDNVMATAHIPVSIYPERASSGRRDGIVWSTDCRDSERRVKDPPTHVNLY